ncbi:16734_t:CDS:2 [Funneliformis mosseae]|uniref:16734_t:CDS:1 n=1 Tax=Funneliformis mosseae TaxID=27381 RepID=A0A9N9CSG7_FUNMO|nr:16734_t:CDS:2 [Funneliformis mosseae]
MVDIDFIYNISLNKLHNFQTTRGESDGLRKLVLLNNFVFKKFGPSEQEPLEWSEEDIKKDEQSWLDACLDGLDEEEEGYVYVNRPLECHQPSSSSTEIDRFDVPQIYDVQHGCEMECEELPHEEQISKGDNAMDDIIISHDDLHLPFFDPGGGHDSTTRMEEEAPLKNTSENLTCEKGFHPYWKDNSIIAHHPTSFTRSPRFRPYLDLSTHSFGIPKIFHRYRLGQCDEISSPQRAVLDLIQPDYLYQSPEFYEASLKRSKDDLDILYSLNARDLDQGGLMDIISMLEYYGGKNREKKSNSSENNDIWFVDNNSDQ